MNTRFAPSPTGHLHIGHAWSALFARQMARNHGGYMILRVEDIDLGRCRPEFTDAIFDDLSWVGLSWPEPVRRQSDHFQDYSHAIQRLDAMGLLYPCFCTRKDIVAEIERADTAPHGPEGALYPGTCRHLSRAEQDEKIESGAAYALRLDVKKAMRHAGHTLTWRDLYRGEQTATPDILGDVVLARKGMMASYHLCVTLDDHIQNIRLVTRGDDLFYASHLHRLLQHLLDLSVPEWAHHPLLLDSEGKRFAKRNQSVTLRAMRDAGQSPDQIIQAIYSALPGHGPWRRLLIDL